MTGINSTLINSENKENQFLNTLSENSAKLLELLNTNHGALNYQTINNQDSYIQISLRVEELNKLAEGMSTLASIIALNPTYKINSFN